MDLIGRVVSDQTEPDGGRVGLVAVADSEFLVEVRDVCFGGGLADEEPV